MSPAVIALLLVGMLIALLPVWRLHVAGWPAGWLFTMWVVYSVGIIVGVRFPGPFRLLLPILVVLYVAPFVIRPERLSRLLNGRGRGARPVINVTPRPAPGLDDPAKDDEAAEPDGLDGGTRRRRGR
jgi:hypothetical protein